MARVRAEENTNAPTPDTLTVRVLDQYGNSFQGAATVDFAITDDGFVTPTTYTTGGQASTQATFTTATGYTITATSGSLQPVTFAVDFAPGG